MSTISEHLLISYITCHPTQASCVIRSCATCGLYSVHLEHSTLYIASSASPNASCVTALHTFTNAAPYTIRVLAISTSRVLHPCISCTPHLAHSVHVRACLNDCSIAHLPPAAESHKALPSQSQQGYFLADCIPCIYRQSTDFVIKCKLKLKRRLEILGKRVGILE